LICKVESSEEGFYPLDYEEEFRPLAYEFFHYKESYEEFLERSPEAQYPKNNFPKSSDLDFTKFSYCIFYGRSLQDLYFSYETTYFEDPSPSYASCRSRDVTFVVAKYNNKSKNNIGIFFYKINRNDKLSGVGGL
jgi:hypothetical protein